MKEINNNSIHFNTSNTISNSVNGNYLPYYLANQPIEDTFELSTKSECSCKSPFQNMKDQTQIMLMRLLLMLGIMDMMDDGKLNSSIFNTLKQTFNNNGYRQNNQACYDQSNNVSNVPNTCKDYPVGTIKNTIIEEAKKRNIPPAIALAMFEKESGFKTNAVGDSGKAHGLGQLHAAAAREGGISPEERFDPQKNIQASLNYLKQRYNETGNWQEALGAYNQGPGGIKSGTTRNRGLQYASDVIRRSENYA